MSNEDSMAISRARLAKLDGAPSGQILTFEIYHPECFVFPNWYIEALARHDEARYVQWEGCFGRVERWIRVVPLKGVAIWANCDACWQPMRPEKAIEPIEGLESKEATSV